MLQYYNIFYMPIMRPSYRSKALFEFFSPILSFENAYLLSGFENAPGLVDMMRGTVWFVRNDA